MSVYNSPWGALEDRLESASFEQNSWWEQEKQRYPEEELEEEPEEPEEEPEQEKEYEPPMSEKFGRWAERKVDRAVGTVARAGLRMLADSDYDNDSDNDSDPNLLFEIPIPPILDLFIPEFDIVIGDEQEEPKEEFNQEEHDREIREFWENRGQEEIPYTDFPEKHTGAPRSWEDDD